MKLLALIVLALISIIAALALTAVGLIYLFVAAYLWLARAAMRAL